MKYTLILLLTSCAYNTTIPNSYRTTKLFEYTYSCPSSYIMAKDASNRLFCVLRDFDQNTKHKQIKRKPPKTAKKHIKIDYNRVFEQANACMVAK